MEVRRIGPDGGFLREFSEFRSRVKSLETKPAGNIVIRQTLTTEDPETGVKTIFGELPDGSFDIERFVGDTTPPPVATVPIVSAQPGIFTIGWDGLFLGGVDQPRDFVHVNVIGHKMDGSTTLSSVEVGAIRIAADTIYVTQDIALIGETWQFSLESEDYNGNKALEGARSATVTMLSVVTDEGVTEALEAAEQAAADAAQAAADAQLAADAAQDAADAVASDLTATDAAVAAAQDQADLAFAEATDAATAAGNAQTTADGKNRIWIQTTAPAGILHKQDDIWLDSDNDNKISRWNDTADTWDESLIGNNALYANIDAGKMTVGFLAAARIAAKSIEADKLVLSSTDNVMPEGDFSAGGIAWGVGGAFSIDATGSRSGSFAFKTVNDATQQVRYNTTWIPVEAGSAYRMSVWIKSDITIPQHGVKLWARTKNAAGTISPIVVQTVEVALSTGSWYKLSGTYTIPAGALSANFGWTSEALFSTGNLWVDSFQVTRAGDATLIVDGSIDGKTITGALFQSTADVDRGVKLNSLGLKAYDPDGLLTFNIDSTTGAVSSAGTFATTTAEVDEGGGGTMTIGAVFGNLTYDSHTSYSGIPGIRFTRTHSSEGEKPPASIMYDGNGIILTTYDSDESGFVPNIAGGHLTVGEGSISMGAGHSGATFEATEDIPSPHFELDGGTPDNPGFENIDLYMSHRISAEHHRTGVFIGNYFTELVDSPQSTSIYTRNNHFSGTLLGSSRMEAGAGGEWIIIGRKNSDGSETTRIQAEESGTPGVYDQLNIKGTGGVAIFGSDDDFLGGAIVVDDVGINLTGEITINGSDIDTPQVQVFDVSGTIANAAVVMLGTPTYNASDSTTNSIGTASAGGMTVTETGVYEIGFHYGNAALTTTRSFIDINKRVSGVSSILGRFVFTGDDSGYASVTGIKLLAGNSIELLVLQQSGASRTYNGKLRVTKLSAPITAQSWGAGDQTVDGNLIVSGNSTVNTMTASGLITASGGVNAYYTAATPSKRVPAGVLSRTMRASGGSWSGGGFTNLHSTTVNLRAGSWVKLSVLFHASSNTNATYVAYSLTVNGSNVRSYTKPYALAGFGDTTCYWTYYQVPSTATYTIAFAGQIVVQTGATISFGANEAELGIEDVGT